MLPFIVAAALALASHSRDDSSLPPTCDSREGVFFSAEDFPGTPGAIANTLSSPEELREHVASWRTAYTEGPLTQAQHKQFFDEGYVIVHNILPHDLLQAAIAAVDGLVDDLAERLLAAGKITNGHKYAGFQERLSLLEKEFPHANVLLHKNGILPLGIANVWSHPSLIGIAQQLLGETADIFGQPVRAQRARGQAREPAPVPALAHAVTTVPLRRCGICDARRPRSSVMVRPPCRGTRTMRIWTKSHGTSSS